MELSLILALSKDCRTQFVFADQYDSIHSVCQMVRFNGVKGFGLTTNTSISPVSVSVSVSAVDTHANEKDHQSLCQTQQQQQQQLSLLLWDQPLVVWCSGSQRERVCLYCHRIISKKAFVRDDCPMYKFCSRQCMTDATSLLDILAATAAAAASNNNSNSNNNDVDMTALAVIALWNAIHIDGGLDRLMKAMQLFVDISNKNSIESDQIVDDLSLQIFSVLSLQFADTLLQPIIKQSGVSIDRAFVRRFLTILRYNLQTIHMTGPLALTSYLCLFPMLGRLNHSCRPNCAIVDHWDEDPRDSGARRESSAFTTRFQGGLRCIRSVKAGEELTISYLRPLCLDLHGRRELLRSAFHFHCECERCFEEQMWEEKSSTCFDSSNAATPSTTYQRNVLRDFIDQYERRTDGLDTKNDSQPSDESLDLKRSLFTDINAAMLSMESLLSSSSVVDKSSSKSRATTMKDNFVDVYLVHTAAMTILAKLDSPASKLSSSFDIDRAHLVMQACNIISRCWIACGSEINMQRAEFLIKGAASGAQLLSFLTLSRYQNGSFVSAPSIPDLAHLLDLGTRMMSDALAIVDVLYPIVITKAAVGHDEGLYPHHSTLLRTALQRMQAQYRSIDSRAIPR